MPKVWVVNTSKHDYSPAAKFGTITPIFRGTVSIFEAQPVVDDIIRILDEHAAPEDYVLLAGYTFLNMLVGHYMFQRFGKVNSLIFSHNKTEYRPMTVYSFKPGRIGV